MPDRDDFGPIHPPDPMCARAAAHPWTAARPPRPVRPAGWLFHTLIGIGIGGQVLDLVLSAFRQDQVGSPIGLAGLVLCLLVVGYAVVQLRRAHQVHRWAHTQTDTAHTLDDHNL
jgi:uncharacterized membrane protein YcjF (UPF0283 family)